MKAPDRRTFLTWLGAAAGAVATRGSAAPRRKPNVILFGELLPEEALSAAWEETDKCDLMLVAGSSLEVIPAAHLPLMARRGGAKLVIVNFEPTRADSYAEVVIRQDVAEVLPKIAEIRREKR